MNTLETPEMSQTSQSSDRSDNSETLDTLVTILIPCRDAKGDFFREAIASVHAQTQREWELCVVDDSSSLPETLEVLGELRASTDPRIRVVRSESARPSVTGALNTGMRQARSPFVCSLHCDDRLEPIAIETLSQAIRSRPDVDFFHSSRRFIDAEGTLIGERRVIEAFALEDFKRRGPVKHLHCWRVSKALAIGGMDEKLGPHGADDYDFPWCMAEAGTTFHAIREFLYQYRDHREHYRLTTHVPLDTQVRELEKIWKKHGLTAEEVEEQRERRLGAHLQQALYRDDQDREHKERSGWDIREGWRVRRG